jgi:hypothetical protein
MFYRFALHLHSASELAFDVHCPQSGSRDVLFAGLLDVRQCVILKVERSEQSAQDETLADKKIVFYSSDAPDKKANAALLIALYAVRIVAHRL